MELNDEQILEAIRGQYKLYFMQIELSFPIKYNLSTDEIDKYSDKDFATFVHEYIHYLQNISTPWGLYNSMVKYEKISNEFAFLQANKDRDIRIPIKVPYPEDLNRRIIRQYITLGRWEKYKINIDESRPITISDQPVTRNGITEPMKFMLCTNHDGTQCQVPLGAWVIMESMTAIFQEFIDPSSAAAHSDVPYNIVSKYVRQNYPDIYNDKGKLVALLYSSLFSINPGLLFMDRLEYANKNKERTATQLFDDLVNLSSIHMRNEDIDVRTFYNEIENKFCTILQKILLIDLDYIAEILKRVNINNGNGFVPIVTIISDGIFDRDRAKSLISYLGIPYVYSKLGGVQYPYSTKQPGKNSDEIIALIGARALSYVINNAKCELSFCCDKGEDTKPECKITPWKGKDCPITAFYKILEGK